MFWQAFGSTSAAVMQIFILGVIGYLLVSKNILGKEGLDTLSRLVIEVTLPLLMFFQLITEFNFRLFANWWVFPIISLLVTIAGFLAGALFSVGIKGRQHKWQFLSLVTFQNSGYLPLVLTAALLPKDQMNIMFIYIFLFLLGFNLIIWSVGVQMLSLHENKRFELGSLFSPPVIATLAGLMAVFFNLQPFIPEVILKPMQMIGNCTFPLAMFVVGGSLALVRIGQFDIKAMVFVVLAKLIILPALGLWLVIKCNFPQLVGLLILMQLAVPPATSLSVIMRHYKKEDLLLSQGIFIGHIVGLVTLPVFLSLYLSWVMLK